MCSSRKLRQSINKTTKASTKNVYIDIDGVILTKGVLAAAHLEKFLTYILKNYSVFWLSPRCRGNSKNIIRYLSRLLPTETVNMLKKIKPTDFSIDKTEAIDFNQSFFWLDNEIFESEKTTLIKRGKFDSWIEVNLIKSPNQLLYLMNNRLRLN